MTRIKGLTGLFKKFIAILFLVPLAKRRNAGVLHKQFATLRSNLIMLRSIEGVYRGGQIPRDVHEETYVIITFLESSKIDLRRRGIDKGTDIESSEIDLRAKGIDKAQAIDLRARLATFAEDWESPEMNIYDITKSNL